MKDLGLHRYIFPLFLSNYGPITVNVPNARAAFQKMLAQIVLYNKRGSGLKNPL
jgi:hypothetical protein